MVDTLKCESWQQLTPEFLDKLLTGAITRKKDKLELPTITSSPPLPTGAVGHSALPATATTLTPSASSASMSASHSHPHPGPSSTGRNLSGMTLVNQGHRQSTTLETLPETPATYKNGSYDQNQNGGSPGSPLSRGSRKHSLPYRTLFGQHDYPETGSLPRRTTDSQRKPNPFDAMS